MIFLKDSLIMPIILVIAVWVMPATPTEGLETLRGLDSFIDV